MHRQVTQGREDPLRKRQGACTDLTFLASGASCATIASSSSSESSLAFGSALLPPKHEPQSATRLIMVTITAIAMNAINIDPDPGSSEGSEDASAGGWATPPTGTAATETSWETSAAQEAATLFIAEVLSCSGCEATLPVEQEGREGDGGKRNVDGNLHGEAKAALTGRHHNTTPPLETGMTQCWPGCRCDAVVGSSSRTPDRHRQGTTGSQLKL